MTAADVKRVLLESAEVKRASAETISDEIAQAGKMLIECYARGGKTLIFGNGGSAADAQHYAAELVGRFNAERRALPALALTVNSSTLTSVGNDYGYAQVFTRQIEAFTSPGDVVIAVSTSGTSENILAGVKRAQEIGAKVIGLSGKSGGQMLNVCDLCIVVPSQSTARIQETHITILHIWCDMVEKSISG
jgi:D-sedoheptulose 7-phosphate isomerase